MLALRCGKFLSVGGEFVVQQVVELLWDCPSVVVLVVLYNTSVAGVRVVEFGTEHSVTRYDCTSCNTAGGHL